MLQNPRPAFARHLLLCIFFEQGYIDDIDEIVPEDADLRDEFGLDSQEIVELASTVDEICIGAEGLGNMEIYTAGDVLAYLEEHLNIWLGDTEQMVMQGSIVISKPVDTVFGYIADCEAWPKHLNHVTAIDDLQRDGKAETFRMSIRELTDGREYSVDSSRTVDRELHEIDFVQPRPPEGFLHHAGGWRFVPLAGDWTRLVSFHKFTLKEGADLEDAAVLIRKHIRAALKTWALVGAK